jgi:aminoglycoside phosphotransferase (APT) family kinase protein
VFGRDGRDGPEVVVKIERIPGALAVERTALQWLTGRCSRVPALERIGQVRLADGRLVACLVMDRVPGVVPQDDAAWGRMGKALAELNTLPWQGSGLAVYEASVFRNAHRARVCSVEAPLRAGLGDVGNWTSITDPLTDPGLLVLTHGDPGPGNFLDDCAAGHLIDFEAAHVAPRGLDLGRAMFIALLGSGPEGFVARDHISRARAVAAGYLDATATAWQPDQRALMGWLTIAAVQFVYRRIQRAGQPGVQPAAQAVATLAKALSDRAWLPC